MVIRQKVDFPDAWMPMRRTNSIGYGNKIGIAERRNRSYQHADAKRHANNRMAAEWKE
jgi:hypothetical protein